MPDLLLSQSHSNISAMSELARAVANEYRSVAKVDGQTAMQYIGLPSLEQLRRASLPVSKGFFDNFFADVAAYACGTIDDDYCHIMPCEPSDELNETNFWIARFVERGLQLETCKIDEEAVGFDMEFYAFLKAELSSRSNASISISNANSVLNGGEIYIDIPYIPDWYYVDEMMSDADMALVETSVRITLTENGPQDFSDVAAGQTMYIEFVEDNFIRVMLECHEDEMDADLNATNENLADVLKSVFGTRQTLIDKVNR